MEQLENNNLFSDKRYGFVIGRFYTTQLLDTPDIYTKAIHAIYMDF